MKILVVDDDPGVRRVLRMFLERSGYEVTELVDGVGVFDYAPTCDLVILDLMLPELSGWAIAELLLRDHPDLPIIILTGCDTEDERVFGLELGAFDYVVKPFSPREVIARVKGILKRNGLHKDVHYGDLLIQTDTREVYRGSEAVQLTKLEFDLLLALAQYPGMVWSRERLLERVWGPGFPVVTRVVDVRIAALRKKLQGPSDGHYIETVHGVGYRSRNF